MENSAAGTIVILTEEALTDADAERLTSVHTGDDAPARYHVLVPADVRRSLLADVLDHLSLLELREALEAVRGDEEPTPARAGDMLSQSLVALRQALVEADGEVIEGEPVQELQKRITADVREVMVVTSPHAVEDTFHRDWASKARESLGVPVLHVYAGSSFLG
jgi:hypothetical protein